MLAARSLRFAICSVALVAFCLFLWPRPASADKIVTINDITYDISTVTGPYSNVASQVGNEPWYTGTVNHSLADTFSEMMGGALGIYDQNGTSAGPIFVYNVQSVSPPDTWYGVAENPAPHLGSDVAMSDLTGSSYNYVWAHATIVASTPEPGTLSLLFVGLLGLGLLAGVKRYRGNRLQTQE